MPPVEPAPDDLPREVDQPTLSRLTGVRSGKQSYYVELRRTEARMTSAVQALEGISGALVRTRDDPRALLEEVLRILADQAAVSMHTATLYATGADLRLRAQQLYDETTRSSRDLRTRTAELERAEGRLRVLHQRELLDAERHRIALELHDSVAQYVLSAGLADAPNPVS